MADVLASDRLSVPDTPEGFYRLAMARHWSDGLPVIPPTEAAVREVLRYTDREPGDVLGTVPPRYAELTVEKLAINAVLAGCRPEYFPVVLAAAEALLEPQFNLYGVQATTYPAGTVLLVSGPLAHELEVNAGYNVFGQGWRANATIGRAIRLMLMNVGGGVPGRLDRATMGQPGKFTFCFAENADASPWEPCHVDLGYPREATTVTVHGGEGPININDHNSNTGEGILTTAAGTMSHVGNNHYTLGGEALLVLGPEHAATIAGDGFSKQDVRRYVFEHAARRPEEFAPERAAWILRRRFDEGGEPRRPDGRIPMVAREEDILVCVAGGSGKHSMAVLSFGTTRSATRVVALKDGTPIGSIRATFG